MLLNKSAILALLLAVSFSKPSMSLGQAIHILPEPVNVDIKSGEKVKIGSEINWIKSEGFTSSFEKELDAYRRSFIVRHKQLKGSSKIELLLNSKADPIIGKEGYRLATIKNKIVIKANTEKGLFYGLQTVEQLANNAELQENEGSISSVSIVDYPKVAWRGMLLDVARHFFTKEEVMKYIDEIASFKFNLLQLHLTDDGGWRIEIKKYPKLTSVGAWGVEKYGNYNYFSPVKKEDKYNYGGYYTQADMKEIIQYAKNKFVDILPEIDVPGHSMAAVAAYPQLSGTKDAVNYKVYSGENGFMDWTDTGIVARYDNTLSPVNDFVYEFLDGVFTEVAALFPFEYIHVGGDECAKNYWKKNPKIAELMKRENLSSYEAVQSYFEQKVEKIVASKNKKVIGWDEILEGGIKGDIAVMSWRGEKGGKEAAKLKHEVIMTPNDYVYIDLMQGNKYLESPVYQSLRLEKVYQFNPIPEGIDEKYVKGGQANLWTEQVYTFPKVEYMTWPRSLAVSESLWSPQRKKNWNFFVDKVGTQMQAFERDTISFATSMYEPDIKLSYGKDSAKIISLSYEKIPGIIGKYTFDGSFPTIKSASYQLPFELPIDAQTIRVQSYLNGKKVGRLISVSVKELKP